MKVCFAQHINAGADSQITLSGAGSTGFMFIIRFWRG